MKKDFSFFDHLKIKHHEIMEPKGSPARQALPNLCKYCLVPLIQGDEGMLCPLCGVIHHPLFVDESNVILHTTKVYLPYNRMTYFKELIHKACGENPHKSLTLEVLQFIKRNMPEGTFSWRKLLKKLHLSKFYNDIPYIEFHLTGKKPLSFMHLQENLMNDFLIINRNYNILKKNPYKIFFNYHFAIHKLLIPYQIHYPIFISPSTIKKYNFLWDLLTKTQSQSK